jgi:AI-2 transport protein TqsA
MRTVSPAFVHLAVAILVLALLFFARSVFVPLAFSLFLVALVWPLQARLQRTVPKLIALLATLAVTLLVVATVGSLALWSGGRLAQWLYLNVGALQAIYSGWADWLEEHGIPIAGMLADHFDALWLIGIVQNIAGQVNSLAGSTVLLFIFVMLGLLEVDEVSARLGEPAAQPLGARMLRANRQIGAKLRRFMVVRTAASVLTGLAVWLFAAFAGLELAAAWGAMAFTLNYIPFLGAMLATLLPTLFAIAQFDSWQMVAVVLAGLTAIQFFIGSYMEPRLTGASLAISPFAVVFAVFFWSFMWGLAGAFIGVPILIAFIVYCAQEPSSRWLATLLSASVSVRADHGDADPPER